MVGTLRKGTPNAERHHNFKQRGQRQFGFCYNYRPWLECWGRELRRLKDVTTSSKEDSDSLDSVATTDHSWNAEEGIFEHWRTSQLQAKRTPIVWILLHYRPWPECWGRELQTLKDVTTSSKEDTDSFDSTVEHRGSPSTEGCQSFEGRGHQQFGFHYSYRSRPECQGREHQTLKYFTTSRKEDTDSLDSITATDHSQNIEKVYFKQWRTS